MPTINDANGTPAGVNNENRVKGEVVCTSEGSHYSQHEEQLFSWLISDNTSGAEYVLAIRNDDPVRHLCFQTIRCSSDVDSIWTGSFGTWSTVGGGTPVVAYNARADAGKAALATAYMTATNIAELRPLLKSYAAADKEVVFRPDGKVVLGYYDVFYIHNSAASTASLTAMIWGFYKELDR
jgi:hypothetical protein